MSNRSSLNSSSAFSSRVPSVIAFANHPASIHLRLTPSEENILAEFFEKERNRSSYGSYDSSSVRSVSRQPTIQQPKMFRALPPLPTKSKSKSRFESFKKRVTFKKN